MSDPKRIMLITGAAGGIGRATVQLFAQNGWTVIGVDRAPFGEPFPSDGFFIQADIADPAALESIIAQTRSFTHTLDALVNNAGIVDAKARLDEMGAARIARMFAVNTLGSILCAREAVRRMSTRLSGSGGAIVNVSSVAGLRYIGKPQVAYAAAKAGLMQFTRTTAVIHAAEHIRLNCVVPGLMHTPLIDGLAVRYAGGDTQGFIDHRNGQVPMRQMGTGWDTAHAALFLAADESRYVTGTCIVVDGGLVAATR